MIKLLLLTQIFYLLVCQQQCPNQIYFQQFEDFFLQLRNQDLTIISSINDYLNQKTSQIISSPTLCPDFQTSSCCSKTFMDTINSIAYLYYYDTSEKDFPFTKIIDSLQESIQNCGIRDESSFKSIYQAPIQGLKDSLNSYRQKIASLIFNNLKFTRANMCILCMPQSQSANYIQNGKLKINNASFQQYISDMTQIFQGLEDLKPQFKKYLQQYFTNYADTTKCASVLLKFNQYMDNLQFCLGGDCQNHILQRVNIFKQEMDQELIFIPYPNFGFTNNTISIVNQNRLLTYTDSFILPSDNTGLSTYYSNNSFESQGIFYQGVSAYVKPNYGLIKNALTVFFMSLLIVTQN